jgi:carbonic anhydrase/acetyltransferase-like protein (isoleucine patch superfamily)
MFHVKQFNNFPLSFDKFWDEALLPYNLKELPELAAPWDLLKQPLLGQLISKGEKRPGVYPLILQGLTTQDYLFHQGKLYPGLLNGTGDKNIKIEGGERCAKGEMRCYLSGKELVGASWIQPGVYLMPGATISLGEGCFLQTGAYLEGPTSLGRCCEVRQGAFVRGNLLAGNNCIIGHTSELKGVVMHDHAKAPHFAYVGDSILGAHVNLGAGTKVSNLKITGTEIVLSYHGESFPTGMRKLGGILGDKVETGCNSVLNPGVVLGRECCVYPAMAVKAGIYAPQQWLRPEKPARKIITKD